MNIRNLIWDVFEIKNAVHDDADIDDTWILNKVNMYRALFIEAKYNDRAVIDPTWLQKLPVFQFTKVTAGDDPLITLSSIAIGKASIPPVVTLPEDIGTYRISGSSGILPLEPCSFNMLMLKAEMDEKYSQTFPGYYSRIGNVLYSHPYIMEGSGFIIAANPMEIQILDGNVYRDRTYDDDYPLDMGMAQQIIIEILTKDLRINEQQVSDITNDAQSQLKILKDGASVKREK